MNIRQKNDCFDKEKGAVAVIVALMLPVFLGIGALAVDIGHLAVVRNELQNAADAGALAGARQLYNADGTMVNVGANGVAKSTAQNNLSENIPVEVEDSDVQRGHWSFATSTFTPNDSTDPVDLWGVSSEVLDADPDFINAVKVTTKRESTPATSFFARIFGYEGFGLQADAVAYIGFAGTVEPEEVDQPIAICSNSITNGNGDYNCNIGRMVTSDSTKLETAAWTDFNQDDPCSGGTNANIMKDLVCSDGNPDQILLGKNIAVNNGQIESTFSRLYECWKNRIDNEKLWNMTLPVVECGSGGGVTTCAQTSGVVNVNIVWIQDKNDSKYEDVPVRMEDWDGSSIEDGEERWNDFVDYFSLENTDGEPAPYNKKSIYFLPDCTPHEPAGRSGGENFGILSKIPALVE